MHLSVGDVATARAFYVDALGFDETAALGNQAVFVSAGGYHHHMAMNVWNSAGRGPRMPALGLGRVDLSLPDADALGELGERLRHHGFDVRDDGRALSFDDPWNNLLLASLPVVERVGRSPSSSTELATPHPVVERAKRDETRPADGAGHRVS